MRAPNLICTFHNPCVCGRQLRRFVHIFRRFEYTDSLDQKTDFLKNRDEYIHKLEQTKALCHHIRNPIAENIMANQGAGLATRPTAGPYTILPSVIGHRLHLHSQVKMTSLQVKLDEANANLKRCVVEVLEAKPPNLAEASVTRRH